MLCCDNIFGHVFLFVILVCLTFDISRFLYSKFLFLNYSSLTAWGIYMALAWTLRSILAACYKLH